MNFQAFSTAVSLQIDNMLTNGVTMLVTDVEKDALYDYYLASFPEGTNPLFRERTEHDCNCCKSFIRKLGAAITVIDGEIKSIWDIDESGVDAGYVAVANAMADLVKQANIKGMLKLEEAQVGTATNFDGLTQQQYHHFNYRMVEEYVVDRPNHPLNLVLNHKTALENSLALDPTAIELVLELVESGSLYRGEEKKNLLDTWLAAIEDYNAVGLELSDFWLWSQAYILGEYANFRGSAIGALVEAIAKGEDLNVAVTKYEKMVAPENYKRSSAPVTQGMINKAMEKVQALGIEPALTRRFANIDDITINNVLFADNSAKESMGVFDAIKPTKNQVPNLDKVEEVSVHDFINNILPKAASLEVMVNNNQLNNFVSLVAPVDANAANILKWGNNFSWSYNGEVTDSLMKERVKSAGGNVEGDVRFSIQWNENQQDRTVDLDAHSYNLGSHVYFCNMKGTCGGVLDVDIRQPWYKVAVENIVWDNINSMPNGDYHLRVHAFSGSLKGGFKAEVAILDDAYEYAFTQPLHNDKTVTVATVTVNNGTATINHHINPASATTAIKEMWGVHTNQFVKVQTVLNSPNHWDGEQTGHKHLFFMLDGCINPEPVRGLYNEFLAPELHENRKVFEVLGYKLKAPHTDKQLSGVGFSLERRNELVCKVSGAFSRIIKIKF